MNFFKVKVLSGLLAAVIMTGVAVSAETSAYVSIFPSYSATPTNGSLAESGILAGVETAISDEDTIAAEVMLSSGENNFESLWGLKFRRYNGEAMNGAYTGFFTYYVDTRSTDQVFSRFLAPGFLLGYSGVFATVRFDVAAGTTLAIYNLDEGKAYIAFVPLVTAGLGFSF